MSQTSRPWGPPGRLQAYGALCAVSFTCYIAGQTLGGTAETLFSAVGAGACGWAWLLTRALFDPAPHDAWWPRIVAFVVAATGALSIAAANTRGFSQVFGNTYTLGGSAALLLTFIEPFNGRPANTASPEKRFRAAFLIGFAALVAVSVLGLSASTGDPVEASRNDAVKSACALFGLVAGSIAVWFRLRHPLCASGPARPAKRPPTAEEARLAERLLGLLQEGIDTESDLKIGDVAHRLGQPEYKVSRCIRAALGFPNFNRLINHHRIERAKRLLAEPGQDRSILDVAFDCGFGSLGPFNRAFKERMGMTPRAFRAANRRRLDAGAGGRYPGVP